VTLIKYSVTYSLLVVRSLKVPEGEAGQNQRRYFNHDALQGVWDAIWATCPAILELQDCTKTSPVVIGHKRGPGSR